MLRKKSLALCILIVFSLLGCTSNQNTSLVEVKFYPQCYDPIVKLCKDQKINKETEYSVWGALDGAVSGSLWGALISGDSEGAAKGAAIGAVAGGTAGFAKAKVEKSVMQKQRLEEYQKILGYPATEWDLPRVSVELSYKCYTEQLALVRNAYKNGGLSKEDALARIQEIKSGIAALNVFSEDTNKTFDENSLDTALQLHEEESEITPPIPNKENEK